MRELRWVASKTTAIEVRPDSPELGEWVERAVVKSEARPDITVMSLDFFRQNARRTMIKWASGYYIWLGVW